jgi:hypothetical protein
MKQYFNSLVSNRSRCNNTCYYWGHIYIEDDCNEKSPPSSEFSFCLYLKVVINLSVSLGGEGKKKKKIGLGQFYSFLTVPNILARNFIPLFIDINFKLYSKLCGLKVGLLVSFIWKLKMLLIKHSLRRRKKAKIIF